jgi:non-ribosomal peptide synthetase component E (peptide arylation enzyme)
MELIDAFPMTKVGKVNKMELRRIIAEKLEGEEKR